MKCRACSYPLWNLPDRRCPECGQEFLPSQFDFVPRSVQYLCPHCKQQYYGTDERGHLVPRAFNCVKCHTSIDMDEMLLIPATNVTEDQTQQEVNPWVNPEAGNVFKRWWKTLGKSMVAPARLIEATPPASTARRALAFALINVIGPWIVSIGLFFLLMMFPMAGGRGGVGVALGVIAVMLGFWIVVPLLALLLWAAITHFILAVTGPSEGFRRTAHCLWYSSGPYIMCSVPCLGGYLSPIAAIWWGVCATIMVVRVHGAGGFRATLAVFTPIIILIGGIVAMIVWFVAWGTSMAATAQAQLAAAQASLQNQRTVAVAVAIQAHGASNGSYPMHAIELLGPGGIGIGELSLSTDPLAPDAFPIGNTTLGQFDTATPSAKQKTITTAIESLPPNTVAHRLGDYVFTYHGINAAAADRGLWVFIAEEPASMTSTAPANPPQQGARFNASPSGVTMTIPAQPSFFAGLADGRVLPIPKPSMPFALQQQNQLRASFGLPPLPDPTTVAEGAPSLGPK